jgi:hypothetical protein
MALLPQVGSLAGTSRPNGVRQLSPALSTSTTVRLPRRNRASLLVSKVAEMERVGSSSANGASPADAEIMNIIKYQFGKRAGIDTKDLYRGTAWAVRQQLVDSFDKTHEFWA